MEISYDISLGLRQKIYAVEIAPSPSPLAPHIILRGLIPYEMKAVNEPTLFFLNTFFLNISLWTFSLWLLWVVVRDLDVVSSICLEIPVILQPTFDLTTKVISNSSSSWLGFNKVLATGVKWHGLELGQLKIKKGLSLVAVNHSVLLDRDDPDQYWVHDSTDR